MLKPLPSHLIGFTEFTLLKETDMLSAVSWFEFQMGSGSIGICHQLGQQSNLSPLSLSLPAHFRQNVTLSLVQPPTFLQFQLYTFFKERWVWLPYWSGNPFFHVSSLSLSLPFHNMNSWDVAKELRAVHLERENKAFKHLWDLCGFVF